MLCKLRAANLYPCIFFVRPPRFTVADNSVCRFTWGHAPETMCAPLWNARVLTWCNKHETLGLVFRQRRGRSRKRRENSWKWQTNNHTRRRKVCYVCCMSNQTPEHKKQANYSILRIRSKCNESADIRISHLGKHETLLKSDMLRYNATSE